MRRRFISAPVLCLLCVGVPSLSFALCTAHVSESMTPDAIVSRIKPIGQVEAEGAPPPGSQPAAAVELSANAGEERYKSTCSVCHETGVGGAPKFRNQADWKERMTVGIDGMLKIAIEGKGAMPPKGTCMQCSDQELKMTIEYMLPKK